VNRDTFWEFETGRPPQNEPGNFSTAPIYLPPVDLLSIDGRFYDLDEVCIYNSRQWDGKPSCPRWIVTMEAQDRKNGDNILFHTRVLWSVVMRDALKDHSPHRGRALGMIARERVEDYLRFHPFPARCCYRFEPIVLEAA
jgi:hypothetical protein